MEALESPLGVLGLRGLQVQHLPYHQVVEVALDEVDSVAADCVEVVSVEVDSVELDSVGTDSVEVDSVELASVVSADAEAIDG